MDTLEVAGATGTGQLENVSTAGGDEDNHHNRRNDGRKATRALHTPSFSSPTSPSLNTNVSGDGLKPVGISEVVQATFPNLRGTKSLGKDGAATPEPEDAAELRTMHKFSLYETQTRYYLVGTDVQEKYFRLLKIDRTVPLQLNFSEDEVVYNKSQMHRLLDAIEDGNRSSGGMKLRCSPWAVLGFIRFTEAYYMLVVTQRSQVAMVGGHYIYQIDATEIIPLTNSPLTGIKSARSPDESRFLTILSNLDLHRSFYFSNSYNVSRTLQQNIAGNGSPFDGFVTQDFNDMFIWNHHLLTPAVENLKHPYEWCMPIIHGYVDQSSFNVFGRNIYVTLIARRSRFFAGARFLKRGVNDLGYVANDVETEQIVANTMNTSYHPSEKQTFRTPTYTSFVQHRGSIPLFWTQDTSRVSPKPAIELNFVDPYYSAAALHFDDLFQRYGTPVTVLNLVKQRERTPRESKLLVEYQNAIQYLNQSLPSDKKIQYRAFDMNRANKTLGQDVIGTLEAIAADLVNSCGFFQNGSGSPRLQRGVTRSNCIDCLDRTNTAQFVLGKRALALQLHALGVIASDSLEYDSDACNLFAHMFNDHGDTLASQYGGSHLVNTTDSYRKINNWQSHSRDMLENLKRYYHNSFLDSQRQEAYNLFLGNYVHRQGQPMLWELASDYYLHHTVPSAISASRRRNYINWYTPTSLDHNPTTPHPTPDADWWIEYYKPYMRSHLLRTFAYRMNSTARYLPKDAASDPSPFVVRKTHHDDRDDRDHTTHPPPSTASSLGEADTTLTPLTVTSPQGAKRAHLDNWLRMHSQPAPPSETATTNETAILGTQSAIMPRSFVPADKSKKNTWSMREFYENSLHPHVGEDEVREYERYLRHPGTIPLVSADVRVGKNAVLAEYLARGQGESEVDEERVREYATWLSVKEDPLAVLEGEVGKKRFRLYSKWLKGKSFFKQSKLDAEFSATR